MGDNKVKINVCTSAMQANAFVLQYDIQRPRIDSRIKTAIGITEEDTS